VDERPELPTLAVELGDWDMTLRSGDVVALHAHSYSQEGEDYVFNLLMEGTPCYQVEIARFPVAVVADVIGG
jgi:hypothetical protein